MNPFIDFNMSFTVQDGTAMGAIFSPGREYRYVLMRHWNRESGNMVAFVALNPSTADETTNDPTVTRCINFAKDWGFDGMFMLNAFAWRATDPAEMKAAEQPIGKRNNEYISEYSNRSNLTIVCWGNHGQHLGRSDFVPSLLDNPFCLGLNKTGEPKHPLYLAAATPPRPFNNGKGMATIESEELLKALWDEEREYYIS